MFIYFDFVAITFILYSYWLIVKLSKFMYFVINKQLIWLFQSFFLIVNLNAEKEETELFVYSEYGDSKRCNSWFDHLINFSEQNYVDLNTVI